jgi:endonuclease/exonuclease/phosphatase (EEP) superfamily protein YafD
MRPLPRTSLARKAAAGTCLLATAALVAGCAALPSTAARVEPDAPLALLAAGADLCRTGPVRASAPALDPESFELFNWNVRKGSHAEWSDDMQLLAREADVLTLQEAPLVNDGWHGHAAEQFHSFAPGFRSLSTPTGVLTISDVQPLVQCNLSAREPFLRTSKATVVTEYALNGYDTTLLVVNIHAVNFTLGLGAFEAQIGEAADILDRHHGPVIFTGDFNTWRQGRVDLVELLVDRHGLMPVEFEADQRKRVFGKPLDHVYVRGLDVLSATTYEIETSDHNPMRVWLSIS